MSGRSKAEREAQAAETALAPPPEGLPPEPPRDPADPDVAAEETKVSGPDEVKAALPPEGHVLVTFPDGRSEVVPETAWLWKRNTRRPQSTFRSRAAELARKAG